MSKYIIDVVSIEATKTELARVIQTENMTEYYVALQGMYNVLNNAMQYHEPVKIDTDQETLAMLRSINQAVQRIAR